MKRQLGLARVRAHCIPAILSAQKVQVIQQQTDRELVSYNSIFLDAVTLKAVTTCLDQTVTSHTSPILNGVTRKMS